MSEKVEQARVLIFDVETKPVKAWIWRTGKQVIRHDQIVEGEKFDIICICYKWAHEKKVSSLTWDKNQVSADMIDTFVKQVEQADIVIGQNSDSFDIKQVNTQRMLHRQPPINWPTSEDTMKQIKKVFYVTSSSLDYMAKLLTGQGKDRMTFQDWPDIVDKKNKKALAKMVKYCKKDVQKTQEVWDRIKAYTVPKVHMGLIINGEKVGCPRCGSTALQKRGFRVNLAGRKQRIQCQGCAHFF